MRLLVAGDTHGNTRWVCDCLIPLATDLGCAGIVQLGDFGYWEHTEDGVQYLDDVDAAAASAGIPLFWLRGNHDNVELLRERYDNVDHRTWFGLWRIREHVYHIPDGAVFEWQGLRFRAFGGAYSVDKDWRLELEAKRHRSAAYREDARRKKGLPPEPVPAAAGTIWFPGEEMSDEDMDGFLAEKVGDIDVVLSHDKPRSTPACGLKDLPLCLANQDRLQRALQHHKPALWLHGHLHLRSDVVLRGGTRVICLNCDDQAAGPGWRRADTFCVLDWQPDTSSAERPGKPKLTVITGADALAASTVADAA
jgi:predicted phosphodiesterase